jgi:YD repeat-containing protein
MRLAITHATRYDYDREVTFGDWRLMLRPTDSHALRVVSAELHFSPEGATRWAYDAFGNSICFLSPAAAATSLAVTSRLIVDRYPSPLDSQFNDPSSALPILYDTADLVALGPLIRPATEDKDNVLRDWIRLQMPDNGSALEMLQRLNQSIHDQLTYQLRIEEGVQSPQETLLNKSGACRDYAWLMIEAVRRLGFAARFASGYVAPHGGETIGGGATHAWCEVFLPSLGWIEFDPTNALTESPDLIRIASTRTPEEASPMRGSIFGEAVATLTVSVNVEPVPAEPPVG